MIDCMLGYVMCISLYAIIILLLGLIMKGKFDLNSPIIHIAYLYPCLLIFSAIRTKIGHKKNRFFYESAWGSDYKEDGIILVILKSIGVDLIAPFSYISLFFSVITKKHIIKDDSSYHTILDYLEVVIGFIVVLAIIFMAYSYLK